jgi:midasin (ATPase involved in ribosome maturation)
LEASKHRQAKEIRELKRKLRESRLILPPRAYREVKSSLEPSEIADDEDDAEDEDQEVEDEKDEIHHRISLLIDNMLSTGKRALEKEINDFPESGKGGAKVLTAEEVRDWHQATGSDNSVHDNILDEHPDHEATLEPDDMPIDASDNSFTASEAEVEAMTLLISSSTPPPIFVTKPSQSCLLNS